MTPKEYWPRCQISTVKNHPESVFLDASFLHFFCILLHLKNVSQCKMHYSLSTLNCNLPFKFNIYLSIFSHNLMFSNYFNKWLTFVGLYVVNFKETGCRTALINPLKQHCVFHAQDIKDLLSLFNHFIPVNLSFSLLNVITCKFSLII